jgi:hypothetical protein
MPGINGELLVGGGAVGGGDGRGFVTGPDDEVEGGDCDGGGAELGFVDGADGAELVAARRPAQPVTATITRTKMIGR